MYQSNYTESRRVDITTLLTIVALSTSIFQVYLFQIDQVYAPFHLFVSAALTISIAAKCRVACNKRVACLYALFCLQTMSIFWSPDPRLCIRNMLYFLPFFLIYTTSYVILRDRPGASSRLIYPYAICIFVHSIIVVVFQLHQSTKISYFSSPIASIFVGPNLLDDIRQLGSNALDPTKSGGLLPFANQAAALHGISAFVFFSAHRVLRSPFLLMVGIVSWISVFFVGSKSGVLVCITMTLTYFLFMSSKRNVFAYIVASLVILITAIALPLVVKTIFPDFFDGFLAKVISAFGVRLLIWSFAAEEFLLHPILGHGFGGWELVYPAFARDFLLNPTYPPHNLLICLWTQSGILAPTIAVVFVILVAMNAFGAARDTDLHFHNYGVAAFIAIGWVFVQGMGENWGLVGQQNIQPIVALSLALSDSSLALKHAKGKEAHLNE